MTDLFRADALPVAIALAVTVERLWEYFAKPFVAMIRAEYIRETANRYGPALLALAICALSGLTITTDQIHPIAGTALTGLLVGGGSNLIHDVTQQNQ